MDSNCSCPLAPIIVIRLQSRILIRANGISPPSLIIGEQWAKYYFLITMLRWCMELKRTTLYQYLRDVTPVTRSLLAVTKTSVSFPATILAGAAERVSLRSQYTEFVSWAGVNLNHTSPVATNSSERG